MTRSVQQFLDDTASIQGHLKATWETDPVSGEHIAGVTLEDGKKIMEGYACGNSRCLADFGGVYRVLCPVCGFDRRVDGPDRFMVPVPAMWAAHLTAREEALAQLGSGDLPTFRRPSIEEAIYGLRTDPEVETVDLKRLMPSKWGRS